MCHLMTHITTLGELSEIIFQYGLNRPSSPDTRFVDVRIHSKMSAKQKNHWLIIYNMVLSRWAKHVWQCVHVHIASGKKMQPVGCRNHTQTYRAYSCGALLKHSRNSHHGRQCGGRVDKRGVYEKKNFAGTRLKTTGDACLNMIQ